MLDCQIAGISGDMLLAALIDLGANVEKIKNTLLKASELVSNVTNLQISVNKTLKNGINACKIDFSFIEETHHKHGKELQLAISEITNNLGWSESESNLAQNILQTLIKAESKIHGSSPERVHLHEAGSFDTIADIIGFIIACKDLELLDNCSWFSTPIAVGGGLLKFSHGLTSNPAPATLEILKSKNLEILGGPIDTELTTPTGASILVNLVEKTCKFYPPLKIEAIGYGAGSKDFEGIPNVLRIIQGHELQKGPYNYEEIITIETNVDDVTGELLGNTMNKILELGYAKDVAIVPITSKKRPGYLIQILSMFEHLSSVSNILMTELGTLGIRFFPTMRYTLNRKIISIPIEISGQIYDIPVKIAWDLNNTLIQTKPESDDVLKISKKTGVIMREILDKINEKLENKYRIGKKILEPI